MSIKKIYKVTCDNCKEGTELNTWDECLELIRENEWQWQLIDEKYNHYCPECQEGEQ